jgi:Bacterial PH domain
MAVAPSGSIDHSRRMSAVPARPRPYRRGVARYRVRLAVALVLMAISILEVVVTFKLDQPATVLVGVVSMLVGAGSLCVFAGVGLFYQARPVTRSNSQASLMWCPTPLVRVVTAVMLVSVSTSVIAFTIGFDGTIPDTILIVAIPLTVLLCFIGGRGLVARLEANAWGITCTTPFTTIRLPWDDVRALELRGSSKYSQRIVVVSEDGHSRMLWVFDLRIPVGPDAPHLLVAELEAVRRLAAQPGA